MEAPSRNRPCPCGSGKKYKNCCLRQSTPPAGIRQQISGQYEIAASLYQQGQLNDAWNLCEKVLDAYPEDVGALNVSGLVAMARQDFHTASERFTRAISNVGTAPEYLNNLGNALQGLGRHEEALTNYQLAIRLRPTFAEVHNNLGNALSALWRHAEAIPHYQRALDLRPGYAEALGNLGAAYQALGRPEEAVSACLGALQLNPTLAESLCTLGDAYGSLTLHEEALTAYQEAVRLRPGFAQALNNLGNTYVALNRLEEAAASYTAVIGLEPQRAEAHANVARTYLALEGHEQARESFAAAYERDPGHLASVEGLFETLRAQCAWERLDEVSQQLRRAIRKAVIDARPMNFGPFNAFALPLPPLEQRELVEKIGEGIAASLRDVRGVLPPRQPRQPEQRLRIGYLSGDYRNHPVGHLLGHLFALHDRERFEVIAYSIGPDDGSDYRRRFEQEAERFADMRGWGPVRIASRIRADGIDILVDLHGYTTGGCLPALALRPAPLQIHFLGYPGTVGKDLVDVTLVDAVICPPEHEPTFSEAAYRLPNCYQINGRQPIGETLPRSAYGLPEQGFVFCSFNATYKLTPAIFALWLRLLDRVPHSILWLYRSNEQAERNLRAEAGRLGCPQERIIFGGTLPKAGHLARLRHADLMLDTPVINGHTTASDALWAGVPVLSILGQSFPDRVGASLLTAIGLPELIMPDLAAYEATAVRLATSPEELAALTAKLAANRLTTPLFDTPRFVRNLETAYEELWTRHLGASTPGPHQSTLA